MQNIANEREKAKFTYPVPHFLFSYNYCYHTEYVTDYHQFGKITTQ